MTDSESEADFVGVGPTGGAEIVEVAERAPPQGHGLNPPRRRSRIEHVAMGAIMRLGKARKRFERLKAAINDRLHHAVCGLKRRFLVRCGAGLVFCGTGRGGIMQFRVSGQETSRLSTSIVLDIGFDTQESRAALARRYQVSERTGNRCRSLVSSAYMFLQEQAVVQLKARLLALLAEGQAHERCLHYSMTSFRFDETQERLALPVDPGLAPHQQESSWHVLVARRCSGFGFVLPDGSEQKLFFQSLLPNVPLTTTTAAAIYDGLWCHPVVQRLAGCIEGMALTARSGVRHFAFYVAECDQASSNSKLIAHRFDQVAQAHPGVMCAHRYCSCHEVSLVETCSVLLLGIQLINSMYSIAAVIRSRGYFVRLLRAVRRSVDKCIVVRPLSGRPSEFSMQRVYAHELADFSCSQYKVLEHIEAGASDAIRDRAISKRREKWARLLGLLNGCVWQPPGCRVEVFRNGSVDRDRLVADISKAMTDVVFSHRPGAPILKVDEAWPVGRLVCAVDAVVQHFASGVRASLHTVSNLWCGRLCRCACGLGCRPRGGPRVGVDTKQQSQSRQPVLHGQRQLQPSHDGWDRA